MDLVTALGEFCADQRLDGRSVRTVGEHRLEVLRLHRWLEKEGINWQEVTHKELKRYTRLKAEMSFSTRNNMFYTLRVFYAWCVTEDYVGASPAAGFKSPSRPRPVPKSLKQADVRRLVAHLRAAEGRTARRNEAMFLTALYAGLRAAELAGLQLGALDFDARTITVGISKMGHGRTLAMHEALCSVLEIWCAERPSSPQTALFSLQSDKPMRPNQVNRAARGVARAAGVQFTPHTLRHTFATVMLRRSKNLYAVSKALGHRQVAQTEIYLSADVEDIREDMGRLPGLEDW